jgi:hypothetical protein
MPHNCFIISTREVLFSFGFVCVSVSKKGEKILNVLTPKFLRLMVKNKEKSIKFWVDLDEN